MSIFSDVKDTVATQLAALFTAASLTVTVRKYRSFDWSVATNDKPLLMLSVVSYFPEEVIDYVDIAVFTVVRYGNEAEAATAETTLDDIDQVLIDAYKGDGGTHQKAAGKWRAVNFYQPSQREPSLRSADGDRFSESYLRFYI
jgi:phosphoribosylanthranilate isomerase